MHLLSHSIFSGILQVIISNGMVTLLIEQTEGREWRFGAVMVGSAFWECADGFSPESPPHLSEAFGRFGTETWGAPNAEPTMADATPRLGLLNLITVAGPRDQELASAWHLLMMHAPLASLTTGRLPLTSPLSHFDEEPPLWETTCVLLLQPGLLCENTPTKSSRGRHHRTGNVIKNCARAFRNANLCKTVSSLRRSAILASLQIMAKQLAESFRALPCLGCVSRAQPLSRQRLPLNACPEKALTSPLPLSGHKALPWPKLDDMYIHTLQG